MNEQDKIRLAEFAKPRSIRDYYIRDGAVVLDMANGTSRYWTPDTDANHCEALIGALNKQSYDINIEFNTNSLNCVDLYKGAAWIAQSNNDDVKKGVCKLALKAITDHDGRATDD